MLIYGYKNRVKKKNRQIFYLKTSISGIFLCFRKKVQANRLRNEEKGVPLQADYYRGVLSKRLPTCVLIALFIGLEERLVNRRKTGNVTPRPIRNNV